MSITVILALLAAICFVCGAFGVKLGTFAPSWWQLGVACLILGLYVVK